MEKKYITSRTFVTLLELLRIDKAIRIDVENSEDGKVSSYIFKKIEFRGVIGILYVSPHSILNLLQDTLNVCWQDRAEELYERLERDGKCKISFELV